RGPRGDHPVRTRPLRRGQPGGARPHPGLDRGRRAVRAAVRAPFLLFAAALAGLSRPAAAQEPARLGIWIAGGIRPGHTRFAATRTFTEFAEQGHIDAQYREATGPAGEAGLGWRFARHLWVEGAGSFTRRKEAGSFSAALPHPFFFGALRHAEGDFAGRTARETAVHL